jgi:hypothetical protein
VLIKGTRICLTEVRGEDSETMYRWINDAETVRFNAPYLPVSWSGGGVSRITGTISGVLPSPWHRNAYSASLITHSDSLAARDQNSRNRSHPSMAL